MIRPDLGQTASHGQVAETRSGAQQETLRNLDALLDRLLEQGGNTQPDAAASGGSPAAGDLIRGILDKLQVLIR